MNETPPILNGRIVRLEPLQSAHHDQLIAATSDGELWRLPYTIVPSAETMSAYIETTLERQSQGREMPFVIIDRTRDHVIGSTRFTNIDIANRKREIGYTWLAKSFQRTAANTEMKFLLLQHAFETLGCVRVEFVTDVLNERSRAALARIDAKPEGILRNHMIMPDGRLRDSACFSIIAQEWPAVRAWFAETLR
ncbi:MAG: GNAT family N-acetyltransferase [Chthoniobacterales bacterium]